VDGRLPLEVAIAIVIPPLAMVLAWMDIVRRRDLAAPHRGVWVVLCMIPVVGPLLYIGVGGGQLW
jgi:Phospholipase_D-nuclease N-terminal